MTTAARFSDVMSLADFHKEGERGPWRIERRVVDDGPQTKLDALRAVVGSGRYVPPGVYVGLLHERRGIVMSDTPDERRDHIGPYIEAKRSGGRVLIHGLGLGMVLRAVLSLDNVEHVDVVEVDPDVIALCGAPFAPEVERGRLTIHEGDAFTHTFPKGARWSVVWHDVWDNLCVDNLSSEHATPGSYATLNRRYARRADWQGAWGQELLRYERERWR